MDLVPYQHQLCGERRQQGPVLLLPTMCICYYTPSHSQRRRHSGYHPGMARGYGHSSERKQTVGKPCNSETVTQKCIFPNEGV